MIGLEFRFNINMKLKDWLGSSNDVGSVIWVIFCLSFEETVWMIE